MANKEKTFYVQLGARIAARRKALGITQVQLAEVLGVAQQTMAHYEGGVARIAVESLRTLAHTLDVSMEELVGDADPRRTPQRSARRGPTPRIQRQLEQVRQLPKIKQQAIMQVLDSVLAQASR
ncbi:MAG: helix-turn-helix domain-containing protein [Candidatus Saccharimonadales bacterium]